MWRRFPHFIFGWIRLPAKTIWGDPVPDNLAVGTLFLHARVFQKNRFACQTNYFKFSARTTSDVTSAGPGSMVYRTVQKMESENNWSLDVTYTFLPILREDLLYENYVAPVLEEESPKHLPNRP
jgi:hypothetical protein